MKIETKTKDGVQFSVFTPENDYDCETLANLYNQTKGTDLEFEDGKLVLCPKIITEVK